MRRSKFAFCYENAIGPDNYITKKIFDSFLNGCVPVYWGAENVLEHIPAECFIDRRRFADTAETHRHLQTITPEKHAQFQAHISRYLVSEQAQRFGVQQFVAVIAGHIMADIENGIVTGVAA